MSYESFLNICRFCQLDDVETVICVLWNENAFLENANENACGQPYAESTSI